MGRVRGGARFHRAQCELQQVFAGMGVFCILGVVVAGAFGYSFSRAGLFFLWYYFNEACAHTPGAPNAVTERHLPRTEPTVGCVGVGQTQPHRAKTV